MVLVNYSADTERPVWSLPSGPEQRVILISWSAVSSCFPSWADRADLCLRGLLLQAGSGNAGTGEDICCRMVNSVTPALGEVLPHH